jgi:hypothetical protein
MGDVNLQNKIEHNKGVVMGHAYGAATDGVKFARSSTTVRVRPVVERLTYTDHYIITIIGRIHETDCDLEIR